MSVFWSMEEFVVVALPSLLLLFLLVERIHVGARRFVEVRGWTSIGSLGLLVSGAANTLYPLLLVPMLQPFTAFDSSALGLWAALPVLLLTTFLTYWSHRFDLLWRLGHRLHHSVARVDTASAMMFHPIDLFVQVSMTLLASSLLGAAAEAAALAGLLNFVMALLQHWNLRTPHWLGRIVQRPEAHLLHYQFDVHARNYGDLPLWDMLFGTYENPEHSPVAIDVRVGFAPEAARRVAAMVLCVDVNRCPNDRYLGRRRF